MMDDGTFAPSEAAQLAAEKATARPRLNLQERHCLGCKTPIQRPYICCVSCWRELPPELRYRAERARHMTGDGLRAVQAVADWFRKAETL